MKKKLLLSLTLLCLAFVASAQRTTTLFQKTYKVTGTDTTGYLSFEKTVKTTDGGYAFLGSYSTRKNMGDICVVRTDSLGNVMWATNFTTDTIEVATGINQTPDGGFVVSGYNILPNGGQMILAKIDANGVVKWVNQFGGSLADEANDATVLNSGDILVVGLSDEGTIDPPGYVILTKKDGSPENGKIVKFGRAGAAFNSVDKTMDGGAIAACVAGNFVNVTRLDPGLVKFNALGNVVWGRRYAMPGSQLTPVVRQTRDAGFLLVGQQGVTQPNGSVAISSYAIKTNSVGDTLWCRAFKHETDKFHRAFALAEVSDGYIVSGILKLGYLDSVRFKTSQGVDTIITQEHEDPYAMKIDQNGVFKWGKIYGDSTRISRSSSASDAADGGFTLAGEAFGFNPANRFGVGYVMHLDRDGNMGTGATCKVKNIVFTASVFTVKDSTNVTSIEFGEQRGSTLRQEAITVVKSDICTGRGLNTDIADYRLPDNAVKIYPNPVNTQLFVEIDPNTEGSLSTATIQIFDAMGRLIQSQKTSNDTLQIDVANFAHGIYLLKVEKGGKYLAKKFIVE
jgi:Secretion system C-terminal sorting domain